jgi:hypothetical protein|tara:strand:- start:255 stop:437 length:183 start_codon:yes stop_codon:yes gene_type:complete
MLTSVLRQLWVMVLLVVAISVHQDFPDWTWSPGVTGGCVALAVLSIWAEIKDQVAGEPGA